MLRQIITEENAMEQEVHKIGHNSGLKRRKSNLLSSTDLFTTSRLHNGQKYPSYRSFYMLDRLDKHPEKAQQLSFIDSLMLLRDVYRDDLKKTTMFGARTTPWTQIIMLLSTRFFVCLKNHCNHQQDCFTM
jgi:hypothetical protein